MRRRFDVSLPISGRRHSAAIAQDRLALSPVDAAFVADTQAAGLRHRREGLAYRLRVFPPKLPLLKRVPPASVGPSLRRKLIYRFRASISAWSRRVSALARRTNWSGFYIHWARLTLTLYRRLAYPRR